MGRHSGGLGRGIAACALAVIGMAVAGCGGSDDDQGGSASEAGTTQIKLLEPAEAPSEYPFRVAAAQGYYADEGVDVEIEYSGGSSEVVQQVVAGKAQAGFTCLGAIVPALAEGFDQIRLVYNHQFGSVFGIRVPPDSPVREPADLAGKVIGISDVAGGEVPVAKAILAGANVSEDEVKLLPIGDATAVGIRALKTGQVDAIAGSQSDFFALSVQGVDLRPVGGEEIADLPACGVIVTADFLEDHRDAVEGFLRATAMGQQFGQENPDATAAILAKASPETYNGDVGRRFLDEYLPALKPPKGKPWGYLTVDQLKRYYEFVERKAPTVDLDTIVAEEFIKPANDFDAGKVSADAKAAGG